MRYLLRRPLHRGRSEGRFLLSVLAAGSPTATVPPRPRAAMSASGVLTIGGAPQPWADMAATVAPGIGHQAHCSMQHPRVSAFESAIDEYAKLNVTQHITELDIDGVTNLDTETAGFTITPTSGLETTEAGGTATFTVVLNSQPTANVTIPLTSSDPTEGSVSPAQLTFTATNWNAPQTVTVTAGGLSGQGCSLGNSVSAGNCRGASNAAEFQRQQAKKVVGATKLGGLEAKMALAQQTRIPSTRAHLEFLPTPSLSVLLCSPRGFCAGVVRAIDTVERALLGAAGWV